MRESTRQRSGQTLDVEPIGSTGLDLVTNPALLGPDKLTIAQGVVLHDDALARMKGPAKISRFADPTTAYGAKTLGVGTSKYAWFTPPPFPKGGFGLKGAFVASRPAVENTIHHVWSSWTDGTKAHGVVWMTIDDEGVLRVYVEWESGGVATLTTTALGDDYEYSFLIVYDPVEGTLTIYLACKDVDSDIVAQATGLDADLQPRQDASVAWYLGASYTPGTGVDADSGLGAAIGPFIGFAFRGKDINAVPPTVGGIPGKSLLRELREGTFQDWPNPASRMILFHYPMREELAGDLVPMYDASRFRNDGAYVGTPASAAQLVWPAQNGNVIVSIRRATIGDLTDGAVNLVAAGGAAHYQIVAEGA